MDQLFSNFNNLHLLLVFFITFLISVSSTPIAMKIGHKLNIVDIPNDRKVHQKIMPRSGGIAIFFAFAITYLGLEYTLDPITDPMFIEILICAGLIFCLGLADDKFTLSAKLKFLVQIIIAFYFSYNVHSIQAIHLPFLENPIELGWFSIPFTVFWIVGITNAFNLIDGLDGLASGVAAISSITFFFVSVALGNEMVAFLSLILSGALTGFLIFNSHPAKIFLGDSGSLFIGFFMAALSVLEMKQVAVVSFITPILIFFIPISDTLYAIIRRKIKKQPIFQPDKNHLHHCLLEFGFSHRATVWIIYSICIVLSIGAFISVKTALEVSMLLLVIYLVVFQLLASKIGMFPPLRRNDDDKI